jgi:hypothetical protein
MQDRRAVRVQRDLGVPNRARPEVPISARLVVRTPGRRAVPILVIQPIPGTALARILE